MGEPTVLFVCSEQHPSLPALHDFLVTRARRRCALLALEALPAIPTWTMHLGPGWDEGEIRFPDREPLAFDDLVSVCMDGYYVLTDHLTEMTEEDREYVAVETWAALAALFYRLSGRCLVANHVLRRDALESRISELAHLASHGLPVPRALVTSDPEALEEFRAEVGRDLVFRPVAGRGLPFQWLREEDLERLSALPLCPVHFEEPPEGNLAECLVLGDEAVPVPGGTNFPPEVVDRCLAACRELGSRLGEVTLREGPRGWLATGLNSFVSRDILEDPELCVRVATFLEEGR